MKNISPKTGTDPQAKDAFAVERREQIWRLVTERGRVRTSELAQLLQVTEPTIRKDIGDLAAQGLLIRTHGGAVAGRSMAETGLSERGHLYLDEKRAIAHRCVDLIGDFESVFLDGGTTAIEIAKVLVERGLGSSSRNVKILTNSIGVAEVCGRNAEGPIVLGGRFRPMSGTTVGPLAQAALGQFRVDLAFLGVTGLTDEGFSVADLAEAEVKREVIRRAARVVVPLDHHKIGLTDFITVCPLERVHTVITDRADQRLSDLLAETSVELLITDEGNPDD